MLRLKRLAGRIAGCATAAILMAGAVVASDGTAMAQGKIGPAAPVTYDNRYEIYGGLNFMNFQAGQNLPTRMNLGGAELLGTYWLTNRVGLGADFRGEGGTTPVFPNVLTIRRPLVSMAIGMFGAQVRGARNQHAAVNYHAYFGVAHGVFDGGTQGGVGITSSAAANALAVGLYSNRTKPIGAFGGSIDFNHSKRLAIRLSPDLIVEHFGTETREFFAISGGVVYRLGKR